VRRPPHADADTYWTAIVHQWSSIVGLYGQYADKNPVMLFDLQEHRIFAFPFADFRAELSERSQASLTRQYERALADGAVVVFVRDNAQEKLVSYSLPVRADVPPSGASVRRRSQRK
jgi:hypothetical protein